MTDRQQPTVTAGRRLPDTTRWIGDNAGSMRCLFPVPPILSLLFLPACASHRLFAPSENLDGFAPSGRHAAVYRLQGDALAAVRIWSNGARREFVDGEEGTFVHVGFELENQGSALLSVDPGSVQMERLYAAVATAAPLAPVRVTGDTEARPGAATRVDFLFAAGGDLGPRDIDGFDLRWRVRSDGATVFEQVTPFAIHVPEVDWFYDDDEFSDFVGCPRGRRW